MVVVVVVVEAQKFLVGVEERLAVVRPDPDEVGEEEAVEADCFLRKDHHPDHHLPAVSNQPVARHDLQYQVEWKQGEHEL